MNLFVGNLPPTTTEADLRQLFEPYGAVNSAIIIKDKVTREPRGFGFVEMPENDEALRAIKGLNGSDFGGQFLKVNEARPREQGSIREYRPGGGDRGPRNYGDRGPRNYGDRGGNSGGGYENRGGGGGGFDRGPRDGNSRPPFNPNNRSGGGDNRGPGGFNRGPGGGDNRGPGGFNRTPGTGPRPTDRPVRKDDFERKPPAPRVETDEERKSRKYNRFDSDEE